MGTLAAKIVQTKLRQQQEKISFFDYVWDKLPQEQRDKLINDYTGIVPKSYLK